MSADLNRKADDWFADVEGTIERLERTLERASRKRSDAPFSGLRVVGFEAEPEKTAHVSVGLDSPDEGPPSEEVKIAQIATGAAHTATEAARLATKASRAAVDDVAAYAELARTANSTATVALMIAAMSGGASVVLAIGFLALALRLK
jgi:hypothetical protein